MPIGPFGVKIRLFFLWLAGLALAIFPTLVWATNYDLSDSANYDVRFDGDSASSFLTGSAAPSAIAVGDVNGDGKSDLVFGSEWADNNGADSGSVYVIYGGSQPSGNKPLATSTNYNIRYDGTSGDRINGVEIGDVNGDSLGDLVIYGALGGSTDTGYVWVIFSTLVDDNTGTGNSKPLSTAGNYNIRYNGAVTNGYLSNAGNVVIGDVNGDSLGDLIMGAPNEDEGAADSGSVYVVYSTLVDDNTTTGNNLGLATSTNYNIRYDGATASDNLTTNRNIAIGDVKGMSESETENVEFGSFVRAKIDRYEIIRR